MIELERARWRLAVIWFPSAAVIFLILVAQSMGGAHSGELQRLWGWALPNFLPTIALMLSVFAAEALKPHETGTIYVRRNYCTLAIWISAFYLFVLLISILAVPLVRFFVESARELDRMKMLEDSNLWLGPLQGLTVVALGILFFLKEEVRNEP